MPLYTINQAAKTIGVNPKTLRRWEENNKITPQRTLGNQRRYSQIHLNQLQAIKSGVSLQPSIQLDKILNLDQTAQKLGVSPATVQRWTKEGKLGLKVNNQLEPGYSQNQLNHWLKANQPQPLKLLPAPKLLPRPKTPFPWLTYSTAASLFLSLSLIAYLYLNRSIKPTSPSIQQLEIQPDVQVAIPNVANFLNGRITVGSDTGDLSYLDQKGNLFVKNSALIQGGLHTNNLQLIPSEKPDNQLGRQYVDQTTGNLMYFDGLEWITLNKSNLASASATLTSLTSSASALILPYTVLGGADQEIITINDNSAYPILISQPTKISANLYAAKFIDSDAETYFIDPSNTNLSLSVAGNATISATLTFSKNGEYITNTLDNYLLFSGGFGINGATTYGFSSEAKLRAKQGQFDDELITDNIQIFDNTIKATNNDGLKLLDNDGYGITIADGGTVSINGAVLNVPDYVFEPDYPLLSPIDLQTFITTYHHLPGVPDAQTIQTNGLNLSAIILALLQKTEENVLYILDLNRRIDSLEQKIISPLVASVAPNPPLAATPINSSIIQELREKIATLTPSPSPSPQLPELTASTSAALTELNTPLASSSGNISLDNLEAKTGFFSDYLAVLGTAAITDLTITNNLSLISLTSPTGAINFLANLNINGNVNISGALVASQISNPPNLPLEIKIATDSAMLIYQDINRPIATFSGQIAQFDQLKLNSSGIATISAGANQVIIPTEKLSPESQIILTFSSDYKPATKYWVTQDLIKKAFTIFVNYPVNNDSSLNWLIIN